MTVGELASWLIEEFDPDAKVRVLSGETAEYEDITHAMMCPTHNVVELKTASDEEGEEG
jgi:uncharacterized protein YbbC (DUF1343 family)